jgi:hypothetical protein
MQETDGIDLTTYCPICKQICKRGDFIDHVAREMQRLALFVIPSELFDNASDVDEQDSTEDDSNHPTASKALDFAQLLALENECKCLDDQIDAPETVLFLGKKNAVPVEARSKLKSTRKRLKSVLADIRRRAEVTDMSAYNAWAASRGGRPTLKARNYPLDFISRDSSDEEVDEVTGPEQQLNALIEQAERSQREQVELRQGLLDTADEMIAAREGDQPQTVAQAKLAILREKLALGAEGSKLDRIRQRIEPSASQHGHLNDDQIDPVALERWKEEFEEAMEADAKSAYTEANQTIVSVPMAQSVARQPFYENDSKASEDRQSVGAQIERIPILEEFENLDRRFVMVPEDNRDEYSQRPDSVGSVTSFGYHPEQHSPLAGPPSGELPVDRKSKPISTPPMLPIEERPQLYHPSPYGSSSTTRASVALDRDRPSEEEQESGFDEALGLSRSSLPRRDEDEGHTAAEPSTSHKDNDGAVDRDVGSVGSSNGLWTKDDVGDSATLPGVQIVKAARFTSGEGETTSTRKAEQASRSDRASFEEAVERMKGAYVAAHKSGIFREPAEIELTDLERRLIEQRVREAKQHVERHTRVTTPKLTSRRTVRSFIRHDSDKDDNEHENDEPGSDDFSQRVDVVHHIKNDPFTGEVYDTTTDSWSADEDVYEAAMEPSLRRISSGSAHQSQEGKALRYRKRDPRPSTPASETLASSEEERDQSEDARMPPVDGMSWPVPDTAPSAVAAPQSQEKADNDVRSTHETKSKQAWSKLDFSPEVLFGTLLPSASRRGGKRGARGGSAKGA